MEIVITPLLGNLDEEEQPHFQTNSPFSLELQAYLQIIIPLAAMQSKKEILHQNSRMDR